MLVCTAAGAVQPDCEPGDPAYCDDLRWECLTCIRTPDDLNGCIEKCDTWRACTSGHYVLDEWRISGLMQGCRDSEIYCKDFNEYVDYEDIQVFTRVYQRWMCFTTGEIFDDVLVSSYNTFYDRCSRHMGGGFCFGSRPACVFDVSYSNVPWMNLCQD
jgi:hypothetical protein